MRKIPRDPLIVGAFSILLVVLTLPAVSNSPYQYDEADYMYAARLGWKANYTDQPTLPIAEFFRAGRSHRSDDNQKLELSEQIRGANDVLFYRHWHGPLYFYWLIATSHFGLDEFGVRLATLAFPIFSLMVIYFGALWLFPGMTGIIAAVLSSVLFLCSLPVVRSMELAPHQAFACCSLGALFLLAKSTASGERRYFCMAVIAAALACCLLEVGFVLVATVLACCYFDRHNLRADWTLAWRSLLLFVGAVIVVWPAAILKLSLLKSYAFMAYLSLFRKSPWGSIGLLETWRQRFFASPVEWILIAAGLLILIFSRKLGVDRRVLCAFTVYACLMIAATLRVTSATPRYALVFQPVLDVLAGCVLAVLIARWRPIAACLATASISLMLLGETWLNVHRQQPAADPRPAALLAYIRQNHLEHSRLMVPQTDIPVLHYYFPNAQLKGYYGLEPISTSTSDKDGIVYPDFPIRYRPPRQM